MLSKPIIRKNALLGGVCGGLAEELGLPVWLVRVIFIISPFMTFGVSVLVYLAAVFAFPTEVTLPFMDFPKFLGVCTRLSPKLGIHSTWLRFIVLVAWIATGFVPVFLGYLIVFIIQASTGERVVSQEYDSSVRDVN